MKKRHIITIAGDHASGQGSLANTLNRDLGYEIYRNGQYARKLAKEMGMTIVEFQQYLNEHEELDRQIEKSASDYAKTHDNLVVDAKLGWYAIPDSFKIYLKVDINKAAQRVFNDEKRKDTEHFESIEDAKEQIIFRHNEENVRWLKTYGINRDDMSNYDFVLDTTDLSIEETNTIVIQAYKKWLDE